MALIIWESSLARAIGHKTIILTHLTFLLPHPWGYIYNRSWTKKTRFSDACWDVLHHPGVPYNCLGSCLSFYSHQRYPKILMQTRHVRIICQVLLVWQASPRWFWQLPRWDMLQLQFGLLAPFLDTVSCCMMSLHMWWCILEEYVLYYKGVKPYQRWFFVCKNIAI